MKADLRHALAIGALVWTSACSHTDQSASGDATAAPVPSVSVTDVPASPADVPSTNSASTIPATASTLQATASIVPAATTGGSSQPAASTVDFSDLTGNLHASAIRALGEAGVLDRTIGAFRPDAPIVRRDFVRWLVKTNNAVFSNEADHLIHPAQSDDPSDFRDVASSDPDFASIQGLSNAGVSVGFPDKTFKPDQPITREQAVAIKSALDFGGVNQGYVKDPDFARTHLPQWKDRALVSKTYIAAVGQEMDQERPDGVDDIGRTFGSIAVFRPQKALTRGEAAEMLQIVGGHATYMVGTNQMRSVSAALHPTPAPT